MSAPPLPPNLQSADDSSSQIELTWELVRGSDYYVLYKNHSDDTPVIPNKRHPTDVQPAGPGIFGGPPGELPDSDLGVPADLKLVGGKENLRRFIDTDVRPNTFYEYDLRMCTLDSTRACNSGFVRLRLQACTSDSDLDDETRRICQEALQRCMEGDPGGDACEDPSEIIRCRKFSASKIPDCEENTHLLECLLPVDGNGAVATIPANLSRFRVCSSEAEKDSPDPTVLASCRQQGMPITCRGVHTGHRIARTLP